MKKHSLIRAKFKLFFFVILKKRKPNHSPVPYGPIQQSYNHIGVAGNSGLDINRGTDIEQGKTVRRSEETVASR